MKNKILVSALVSAALMVLPAVAMADTVNVNFENPPYTPTSVGGQDGWGGSNNTLVNAGAINPSYDQSVVVNTGAPVSFGAQSFRISDAVTSGSFGDWVYSKPLNNEAGETAAQNGGMSGGVRQPHFEAQFDIASAQPGAQQPGLHLSVSPDRGDGARMSYVRFEDQSNGIHVFFDDYQNGAGVEAPGTCITGGNFVETDIATLDRTKPHTIRFAMDFVDGADNDVVKIYIDGVLRITGTSWEGYYNYCEHNPTRTVDSLIFQSRTGSGPLTNPADAGKGFLIDNLSLFSGSVVNGQLCTDVTLKSGTNTLFKGSTLIDPSGSSLDSLFSNVMTAAVAAFPTGFPGAWDGSANDANVAGAIFVNDNSTGPTSSGTGADNSAVDSWRLFSQTFTLPAGAVVSPTALYFAADNSAQAFLDDASIGTATGFSAATPTSPFVLTAGSHTLEFVVKNDAFTDGPNNPTGVIYKATVNYCVAPPVVVQCPAAPAIAAQLLKSHGVKPNAAPNLISLVAHQMGPQTLFSGINACDTAAYTSIVNAFLIGHGAY